MSDETNVEPPSDEASWQLVAILAVDKEDRVQCQCDGCGHGVYASIHMILWPDDRIECWGSTCYQRKLAMTPHGVTVKAMFPGIGGRRLTAEEREYLRNNRERLIAEFRAEFERQAAEEMAREEAARRATEDRDRERHERAVKGIPQQEWTAHEGDAAPDGGESDARVSYRNDASSIAPRLGKRSLPPPKPARFVPEPMHDPVYREIRERLEKRWKASGVDPNSAHGRQTLIENALHQYRRVQPP